MKKLVGQITVDERDEIRKIYEHRNSLEEIAMIISKEQETLFRKLQNDIDETENSFCRWWEEKTSKYKWESSEGGKWIIDFERCEVFLLTN